jgi:hypothetical protein
MTRPGPLDLAAAVQTVARILDGRPVTIIGLDGRQCYPHESTSSAVTVTVHLDTAQDTDQVGDLLGLDHVSDSERCLHTRSGDWQNGLHLSVYGPARLVADVVGVGS